MTMTSIPLHEDTKSLLDQKSPTQFDTATKQGDQKEKQIINADKDRKVTEGSDPDPRINLQMIDDSSADSFLADDSEDKQDQNEKLDDAKAQVKQAQANPDSESVNDKFDKEAQLIKPKNQRNNKNG